MGHVYFGRTERYIYTIWTYTLVAANVIFGAACGVVAAGLEFGAYEDYAASYGERLRTAASYVSIALQCCCTTMSVLHGHAPSQLSKHVHKPAVRGLRLTRALADDT